MRALLTPCLLAVLLPAHAPGADLVLRNGDVYTMDSARRWASAVAVEGNEIVFVGGEAGVETHVGAVTRVIDLGGRMLLPGFQNGHLHPLSGGEALARLALDGIETAVTRRHLGGIDPGSKKQDRAWMPEQRLNLEQAIAAYTIGGAYLMHNELKTGSIEVGKLADMVILEENLFEITPLEIHAVTTDMTIFDGRLVYERGVD